jgi:hypothetical protein
MHRGVLVIDERSGNSIVYKPGNVEGIEGKIGEAPRLCLFEARIPMQIEKLLPGLSWDDTRKNSEDVPGNWFVVRGWVARNGLERRTPGG